MIRDIWSVYRALVDHGMLYIFWKIRPRAFHLAKKFPFNSSPTGPKILIIPFGMAMWLHHTWNYHSLTDPPTHRGNCWEMLSHLKNRGRNGKSKCGRSKYGRSKCGRSKCGRSKCGRDRSGNGRSATDCRLTGEHRVMWGRLLLARSFLAFVCIFFSSFVCFLLHLFLFRFLVFCLVFTIILAWWLPAYFSTLLCLCLH